MSDLLLVSVEKLRADDARMAALRADVARLTRERDEAKAELGSLQASCKFAHISAKDVAATVSAYLADIEREKQRADTAEAELTRLREQVAQLEAENEELAASHPGDGLDRDSEELMAATRQSERDAIARAERAESEAAGLREQVARLEAAAGCRYPTDICVCACTAEIAGALREQTEACGDLACDLCERARAILSRHPHPAADHEREEPK